MEAGAATQDEWYMKEQPPRWILKFLKWFCPEHLYEEIEGDLIQKFNRDLRSSRATTQRGGTTERRAKRRLLWNVIRFCRPGIVLRNSFYLNLIDMTMLRKNITLAFRHIRKDWTFSAINLFGLSVSMAACLLIFQYTFFEMSYDEQFPKNIYRVGTITYENGLEKYKSALTPVPVAAVIKEKFSQVTEATRLASTSNWFDCTLAYEEDGKVKVFNEKKGFYFVDPTFISMFNIVFLEGDRNSLQNPFSIVLSASVAKKYFGNKEAVGKTVKLRGSFQTHDYTVTGVMEDFPFNSHLDINIMASINSIKDPFDAYTYLQLSPAANTPLLVKDINVLATKMIPVVNKTETKFLLEPIASIHLHSDLQDQTKMPGNANAVYFLMLVAVIVLVIAWTNYFNLATSRSISRAKEVIIRKVTGATRLEIAFQFLTETFLLNVISFAIVIVFVYFLSSSFYDWVGFTMLPHSFLTNQNDETLIIFLLFFIGIVLSGLFPAKLISSLNPANVLKGNWKMNSHAFPFRKVAVTFQFTCAIILAIAVVTFWQQFHFIKEQVLGIDIKRTIVLTSPSNVDSTYLSKISGFKEHLKSLAIIHAIATSTDVPGNFMGTGWNGSIRKAKEDERSYDFSINVIDTDFIKAYHLKLLAGRDFIQSDFPGKHFGDKLESVIVNRKASEQLEYKIPENVIGTTIYWGESKCLVVGVVEEFHQESLKKAVQPMLFVANMGPSMTLKLTDGTDKNVQGTILQIRKAWDTFFPNNAFDYFFLEDNFDKQYAAEEQFTKIFNVFCVLALIISCLGIFALSLLSINQRLKEISIRKVLGASILNLMRLLSKDYLFLIIIASVIAMPLAYIGVQKWLNGFAVKIQLSVWLFFTPIFFVLFIALVTVGSQALKAALKNPVDNLKHE
jgi:putative ABC transport system permease protein